jgi:pimeloyl-ACP methyl ester carboxylesterase
MIKLPAKSTTVSLLCMLIVTSAFSSTLTDSTMNKINSKTIVFITGAFVNHACWNEWIPYFEKKGYTVIVPPWPGKDGDPATLRARHPNDSKLASVTLQDVIDHYVKIVSSLPEKPILIGHSFGGAISQFLMHRGLAAGVVAIHGAPPKGVFPYEWSFLRSGAAALGFFTSLDKTYMMSFKKWQYAFTNGMSLEEQKSTYNAIATPESKRVVRGGLTNAARVDFKKPHVPILFLAGSKDHIIPAHLCKRVFKAYTDKNSVIEYIEQDRNHYILGLPTWRQDADLIADWISKH